MSLHRRRDTRDYFFSSVMLLVVLGLLLGIAGVYLLILFQALFGFAQWFFQAIVMSGG